MAFSAVQRKAKSASAAASVSIGAGDGWATPTSGNLLVVSANSDATVNTPSGYTLGPSVVDGNGAYVFWKISAGNESTVTVSPTSAANTSITVCEYSGNDASPLDASNTSTISGSGGNTTTAVSVTTTAGADLIVAVAAIHLGSGSGGGTPTGPSWTNSFVNQLSTGTGGTNPTDTYTFYAELLPAGAAGAYSTAATWTGNAGDRQELVIAFKAPASGSSFDAQVSVTRQQSSVTRVGPVVVAPTIGPPQVIRLPQITVVRHVKQPPAPFPVAVNPPLLPAQAQPVAPIVVVPQARLAQPPTISVSQPQMAAAVAGILPSAPVWVNPSQTQPFLAAVTSITPPPLPQPPAPITVIPSRSQPPLSATITLTPSPLPQVAAPIVVVTSTWQLRQPQIVVSQPQLPAVAAILPAAPILVAPAFVRLGFLPTTVSQPPPFLGPSATPPAPILVVPTFTQFRLAPVFVAAATAAAHLCVTPRPNTGTTGRPGSGTTVYGTASTARPSTGITTRPNTGTTQDPC